MKQQKFNIIFSVLLLLTTFFSCGENEPVTKEKEIFEISKYRGYEVVSKLEDQWRDSDVYLIRNDSIAFELTVPVWFEEMYGITDTIK